LRDDEERLALAMRQEDPKVAKRIAQPVLSSAVAKRDRHLEGRVLTLLAQCENLLANSGASYELSSRALPLLQTVGDFREEGKALAVQARSSSALGRNDQAIEAALLRLELAKHTGDVANHADAQSQLGQALFHAGCFDAAKGHLHEARRLAQAGMDGDEDAGGIASGAQPPGDFDAAHPRQRDVEQDQRDLFGSGDVEYFYQLVPLCLTQSDDAVGMSCQPSLDRNDDFGRRR